MQVGRIQEDISEERRWLRCVYLTSPGNVHIDVGKAEFEEGFRGRGEGEREDGASKKDT